MTESRQNFILRPIQPIDKANKLSLGNPNHTPLKTFLQKHALDFHKHEVAKTYVLNDQNDKSCRVWAYITLMNSEIALNEGQRPTKPTAAKNYEAFPAVKIARLAVDKTLQGKGYGSMILDWCISHTQFIIMPHVGCRFLVVDAKRDSINFYQKSGFTLLNTESNHHSDEHPLMFFDLYKETNN